MSKNKELSEAVGMTDDKANQLAKTTKDKLTWHGLLEVFMSGRTERWWLQAEGVQTASTQAKTEGDAEVDEGPSELQHLDEE